MNIQEILQSKKFLDTDQFKKRNILKEYILTNNDCRIGTIVICFDTETICKDVNKYFYDYSKNKKLQTLTIGKEYKILNHTDGKIKIINDKGKNVWCAINRFVYSISIERKNKLNKLKNIVDVT